MLFAQKKEPKPDGLGYYRMKKSYSHSIVEGGLDEIS